MRQEVKDTYIVLFSNRHNQLVAHFRRKGITKLENKIRLINEGIDKSRLYSICPPDKVHFITLYYKKGKQNGFSIS